MKKIILLSLVTIAFFLSAFTFADPSSWQLTDQYSIRFKGKGINGFFHSLKGTINFDEKNLSAAKINLEVEVKSITTGLTLKSWHAKRKKWFNAKEFPTISFASNNVQKTQKGYKVTGKLKMRGVEKEVSIPFSFSNKMFFGSFYVRRTDYNVGKYKGFSKSVSDSILIEFTIPVTS